MTIEWWMIDGVVCLIIFAAAIRGAAKGIGDTIIRIVCIVGGLALGVMYSDRLSAYLMQTRLGTSLHNHIFLILRNSGSDASGVPGTAGETGTAVTGGESGTGSSIIDSLFSPGITEEAGSDPISKSLAGIFDSAADKAADAAADRLTEIAVSIISFALILIAIALFAAIIRAIIKHLRKTSVVIGFTDRVLGFVLGTVRGLMIAWVAVALLIPLTTLFAPMSVQDMLSALRQTTVANVLYDVNPFLLVVRYVFK